MKSLQTEQSVNELVHGKTNDAALRNLCAVTSVLPTLRSLRAQWVISLVARAIGTREGTLHRQLLALYSPGGHKELDMTEQLSLHFSR